MEKTLTLFLTSYMMHKIFTCVHSLLRNLQQLTPWSESEFLLQMIYTDLFSRLWSYINNKFFYTAFDTISSKDCVH